MLEPLRPIGPASSLGYLGSAALLRDRAVREFIQTVRKRDGITRPVAHEGIEAALAQHPPQDYFAEALPVAEDYWRRLVRSERWFTLGRWLFRRVCSTVRRHTSIKMPRIDPIDVVPLDEFARTSAQIIARYIVLDLLEVPQPINYPLALVRRIDLGDDPFIGVLINPGADLDDVFAEVRRQYAELAEETPLARPPDQTKDTVWLRHCARTLRDRGELPRRLRNRILAELNFEVHPERRPDAEPGTDAYNEALAKEADRIGKNIRNFGRYTAKIQDDPEDPTDPLSEI